jgi:glucose-1-phosphate adenylyltransferase
MDTGPLALIGNFDPRIDGVDRLRQRTLALVLAGGRGTRLGQLTNWRAKPAVLFGSRFRIVDFTLANCVNSGLHRIAVLTQYKAQSLIRYIQANWSLDRPYGAFVEIVPAQQRLGDDWYVGTADAVYQNIDLLQRQRPDFVLVLGGDHIYKMDYTKILAEHAATQAEVTVACVEVPLEDASSLGVVQIDSRRRIIGWEEKPRSPKTMPGSRDRALASMGIYVFNTDTLFHALGADARDSSSTHDFGHDVVPAAVRNGVSVQAHAFSSSCVGPPGREPYWRDVGTLDSYWEANIELTRCDPRCDVFDCSWPIYAARDSGNPSRFLADARGRHAMLSESLIGGGCTIGAAEIQRSVLFCDLSIDHGARIEESLVLSNAEVGAGVALRRVIVDKYCRLGAGLKVGFDAGNDRRRFHVTPRGITLITPEMLGQRSQPGCGQGWTEEAAAHDEPVESTRKTGLMTEPI